MDKFFAEGQLAAARGDKLSSCPYGEDSEEKAAWEEGYASYHDHDEEGEPVED